MDNLIARPATIRKSLSIPNDADIKKILIWVKEHNEPCEPVLWFNRNERMSKGHTARRREVIANI